MDTGFLHVMKNSPDDLPLPLHAENNSLVRITAQIKITTISCTIVREIFAMLFIIAVQVWAFDLLMFDIIAFINVRQSYFLKLTYPAVEHGHVFPPHVRKTFS